VQDFVEEIEGKTILGRLAVQGRHIKMDVLEVRWGGVDWIDVPSYRDRFWAVMNTFIYFEAQ